LRQPRLRDDEDVFRAPDLRVDDLRDGDLREDAADLREDEDREDEPREDDERRDGTFFPALRASDRPIAIACFRLFTFLPLRPLFSVPALRSCIARSTFLLAALEYLRAMRFHSLLKAP
jgi:hypothetical protein